MKTSITPEKDAELQLLYSNNPDATVTDVAKATKLSRSAVDRWRQKQKRVSMSDGAPIGYVVKGKSTCRDAEGNTVLEWTKTSMEREDTIEALRLAVADIVETARGYYKPTKAPKHLDSDIMCTYPVADVHLGLYAWKKETGDDWDTDMCCEALAKHMGNLVASAPPAETAFIAILGDFFHADTVENRTLKSGNILDVDTRWGRVVMMGVRSLRRMIELALTKHKKVIVKSAKGNHDEHSGFALMMLMMAYFENEPRVEIHLPINPFQYLKFGESLIGINHMVKAEKLPLIMATDEREMWGDTRWHYWYSGHVHHEIVKEFPGCVVETFRSPAPKDSYLHTAGYRAERSMMMIKHHISNGDVGRTIETVY